MASHTYTKVEIMKKQPSKIENALVLLISSVLAFAITFGILLVKRVVWPLLRFCARASWNGIRRLLSRATASKAPKLAKQLPTPDCFKDAPNLAPARQVRF